MNASGGGRLYGVGIGPGDPELLTVKAVRLIQAAPVVAYFAKAGRRGNARGIVDRWLLASCEELPLFYPVTTELPFDDPRYAALLAGFYQTSAEAIAVHLAAGRDVALLSEGDPLFYGSFIHLFVRLRARFPVTVVPGVTAMSGCLASSRTPIAWGDDVLTVLPGTLPAAALAERLRGCNAAAIMKIGRNIARVRAALIEAGLLDRAIYVERATMADEIVLPFAEKTDDEAPYFAMVIVGGAGSAAMTGAGRLCIVGLGPGAAGWTTPEASAALAAASDLVGYGPYLERLPLREGQRRHASGNRVEIERARLALDLAAQGRRVAVVSGGDPGIFAMAAAVFEAVEAGEPAWRALDIEIAPGLSAMQAAAARLGAPLGHDFCAISLSDNLKSWDVLARRLGAAADGDFVIALYNPASAARPTRIFDAFDLLRARKSAATPVAFARAVGRPDEKIALSNLGEADPGLADMSTLVLIGSSETRFVARGAGRPWMLTPRSYGGGR